MQACNRSLDDKPTRFTSKKMNKTLRQGESCCCCNGAVCVFRWRKTTRRKRNLFNSLFYLTCWQGFDGVSVSLGEKCCGAWSSPVTHTHTSFRMNVKFSSKKKPYSGGGKRKQKPSWNTERWILLPSHEESLTGYSGPRSTRYSSLLLTWHHKRRDPQKKYASYLDLCVIDCIMCDAGSRLRLLPDAFQCASHVWAWQSPPSATGSFERGFGPPRTLDRTLPDFL